jgi:hypothetical protein
MKHRIREVPQVQHSTTSASTTPVLARFSAGAPRGSWPAEEFAAARRAEGVNATVVMDLATDSFVVKTVNV